MAWSTVEHADADALAGALADVLSEATTTAIRSRGQAQLALAGGRTPLPAYRRWAAASAPDARVAIAPTDERWVPATHAANNLAQLQACFPGEVGPRWGPLVPPVPGPVPNLEQARESLALLDAPWDLVLLGMGEDGHFASLFPGDPDLAASLDPGNRADAVIGRPDPLPPEAPYARISLSLARLLRTRRLLLVVTGARKRELLAQAQRAPEPQRWPIGALLHAPGAAVQIHWSP